MNLEILRNFLRNSFFLAIATVIDRIADFVLVIYITRFLSEAQVSSYLVAIATLYLFQNLIGFGLSQLATREFARSSVQLNKCFAELFIISLVLGTVATGILFLITPWLQYDDPTRLGVYILSASILPGTLRLLTEAVFNALEEMHHIAWVTGLLGAMRSAVSIALIINGAQISAIFAVYVVAHTLAATIYLALLVKRFGLPLCQVSIADLKVHLRPTVTLTAMSVFVVGSTNVNVVIAARLTSEFEAALLALAIKPVQAIILLRPIIMRSLYPGFVRMSPNRDLLRSMTEQVGRAFILILLAIPLVATFVASPLTTLMYGDRYLSVANVLVILLWSVPFSFLSVGIHRLLLACDLEFYALRISAWSTLANVLTALVLIPLWGAIGAAVASVLSLVVALVISYSIMDKNLFRLKRGTLLFRPIAAYFLAFLLGFTAKSFGTPWQPALVFFVLSSVLFLFLFGAISKHDIRSLLFHVYTLGKHKAPER